MKNGKKPTLAQKKFLQDTGLDSEKWLIVKDTPEEMVIVSNTNVFMISFIVYSVFRSLTAVFFEYQQCTSESYCASYV